MLELVREHNATRATARHARAWDDAGDLDEPHRAVWCAIRHLFPAHAMATQVDHGCLMVSWTLRDGRRNCTHFAAPIMMRIGSGLLLALWMCEPGERAELAELQAETVRDALDGYDPHSRAPTCGVIQLGD